VFAAGLLADAIENMQQLGWLPFLGHTLWNTTGTLSEDSSLGDVFHSLLGYADRPTVLQVIVWVVFVSVSATLFIKMGRRGGRNGRSGGPPASADALVAESGDQSGSGDDVVASAASAPPEALQAPGRSRQ